MTKGLRSLAMTRIPQRSTLNLVPGTTTTIAGTAEPGCSGHGAPAVAARLNSPSAAAGDSNGNPHIADPLNPRVRRWGAATGTLGLLAGPGAAGFAGEGGPAPKGMLNEPVALVLDEQRDLL